MQNRYLRCEQLENRRLLAAGVLLETGDIVAEIQRWKELAHARDSDLYVAPSQSQTAQFSMLAAELRDGNLPTAASIAAELNYELVEFTDTSTETSFYELREELVDGAPTRGWGTYFVNLGFHQDVLIEVPHPIFDTNSWDVGGQAFRDSAARGFLMAGAHRHANGTGTADVAHLDRSIFQAVHEAWTDESTPWQIHGFGLSKHDGDPGEDLFPAGTDVVISNGDGSISQEVVDLDGAFETEGLVSYSYNTLSPSDPLNWQVNGGVTGTVFSSLAATTNVQGIATRATGGTFVHLELEQSIRFDAENRELAVSLISEALTESTFFVVAAAVDGSDPESLQVTVDFNGDIAAGSLQPEDMAINGLVVSSVMQTDGNTAIFEFSPFGTGSYTATMVAGSVQDLAHTNLHTFHLPFEVTLSQPATTKFFVPDTADDDTFAYAADGDFVTNYSLAAGNNAPRGAAANVAGDTVWVLDNDDYVYVYDAAGSALGQWKALGLSRPEGIATDGDDIWIVDRGTDRVYQFDNAAGQTSGSLSSTSSFALAGGNTNPRGVTTDGTHLWVVNSAGKSDVVFKYTILGSLTGSWQIDGSNANPRGITINPGNVDHIWIVDNGSDRVYRYDGAAQHTSGTHLADTTFTLASGNTNPQGIADPPPAAAPLQFIDAVVPGPRYDRLLTLLAASQVDRGVHQPALTLSGEMKVAARRHTVMDNRVSQRASFVDPPCEDAGEEVSARYRPAERNHADVELDEETIDWLLSDTQLLDTLFNPPSRLGPRDG